MSPLTSTFVKVDIPITFKVFVLTSAVLIPAIPVSCEPSPANEVAEIVPVTVIPAFDVANLGVLSKLRVDAPPLETVSYTHLTLPTTPYV